MAATQKDRINTIIALLNSSNSITANDLSKVKNEFQQAIGVDSLNPTNRRNIMKVLHSTRALDSTLSAILVHYGLKGLSHSLGQYIRKFELHSHHSLGNLSNAERHKYQASIVDLRNKYLHQADSYPKNDKEVYLLISEMQALLTRIASL